MYKLWKEEIRFKNREIELHVTPHQTIQRRKKMKNKQECADEFLQCLGRGKSMVEIEQEEEEIEQSSPTTTNMNKEKK